MCSFAPALANPVCMGSGWLASRCDAPACAAFPQRGRPSRTHRKGNRPQLTRIPDGAQLLCNARLPLGPGG